VLEHETFESTVAWFPNTKWLNQNWVDFRTRNVWIKRGLAFEHEMFASKVARLSNTACLNLIWFAFWTWNLWINCGFGVRIRIVWITVGLVFEHEMFESNAVWLMNRKCLDEMWFGVRTRNVWIRVGYVLEQEMFESKVVWCSNTRCFESNVVWFSNTNCLNQTWFGLRTRIGWICWQGSLGEHSDRDGRWERDLLSVFLYIYIYTYIYIYI